MHTMQCNAALADAAMHNTLQGSSYSLLWFHEFSSSCFTRSILLYSFVTLWKKNPLRGCASTRLASVFLRKLLTFEGISVSAGGASPRNRPKRSSVPLSDKYCFQQTFVLFGTCFQMHGWLFQILCLIVSWEWQAKWEKAISNWEALSFNNNPLQVTHFCKCSQLYKVSNKAVKDPRLSDSPDACSPSLVSRSLITMNTIIYHVVTVQCGELHDATVAPQEPEEVAEVWRRRLLTRPRLFWNHTFIKSIFVSLYSTRGCVHYIKESVDKRLIILYLPQPPNPKCFLNLTSWELSVTVH